MTPVFLNPSSSSSSSFSRDIEDLDQQQHLNNFGEDRSSSLSPSPNYYSYSSSQNNINQSQFNRQHLPPRQFHDDHKDMAELVHEKSRCENSEVKNWMSSKMRLIHKMSNNNQPELMSAEQKRHSSSSNKTLNLNRSTTKSNGVVRVCSDCNTTTTPLWRSGPRGPKSLCNACGIRQRKARRAAAEIEKKPRGKLKLKIINSKSSIVKVKRDRISVSVSKIWLGDFSTFEVLNDSADVAQAAILLMELSSPAFLHS